MSFGRNPFVAKATSVPLAKAAARVMLGASIADLRTEGLLPPTGDGSHLPVDAPVAASPVIASPVVTSPVVTGLVVAHLRERDAYP